MNSNVKYATLVTVEVLDIQINSVGELLDSDFVYCMNDKAFVKPKEILNEQSLGKIQEYFSKRVFYKVVVFGKLDLVNAQSK